MYNCISDNTSERAHIRSSIELQMKENGNSTIDNRQHESAASVRSMCLHAMCVDEMRINVFFF